MRFTLALILAGGLLSACATTSQYTSGADYLKSYERPAYAGTQDVDGIDADVRRIAAVEPDLRFPARIGLARIENGQLTSMPNDEAEHWNELINELGESYGAFVPVSPLVAAMVSEPAEHGASRAQTVVADIRRGSARQHLDYVLIYEVSETSDRHSNGLRLADLTILGLYVLPSRDVKVDAAATAMLIDVRNGYPYGSATALADKKGAVTFAGSGKARRKFSSEARVNAVAELSDLVEVFMEDLRIKSLEAREAALELPKKGRDRVIH